MVAILQDMSPVGIKKATMAGSDLILAVKHQLFALDRHFTAEFTGILTDDAPIPLQKSSTSALHAAHNKEAADFPTTTGLHKSCAAFYNAK